jgi:hypothetical protein
MKEYKQLNFDAQSFVCYPFIVKWLKKLRLLRMRGWIPNSVHMAFHGKISTSIFAERVNDKKINKYLDVNDFIYVVLVYE